MKRSSLQAAQINLWPQAGFKTMECGIDKILIVSWFHSVNEGLFLGFLETMAMFRPLMWSIYVDDLQIT